MRAYHFGNFYLSQIQQGIQAAHAQMELFVKYKEIDLYEYGRANGENPPEHIQEAARKASELYDWAKNHKTMICLNGGNNEMLKNIKTLFKRDDNPYPWTFFKEDKESLAGLLTNVVIVLPERIYDISEKIMSREYELSGNDVIKKRPYDPNPTFGGLAPKPYDTLSNFEVELVNTMTSCRLA